MLFTLPNLARTPRVGGVSAAPAAAAQEIFAMPAPTQAAALLPTPEVLPTLPPIEGAAALAAQAVSPAEISQAAEPQPAAEQPAAPPAEPAVIDADPFASAGAIAANAQTANPTVPLTATPPELQAFTASVVNGQSDAVVGVYVPGVLALPVLQQPSTDGNYISDQDGTVTQFNKPAQFGVTALLAHNFLSGKLFFQLHQDQELYVIYGDGDLLRYRITGLQSYQALSPYDAQSQFVDLNVPEAPVITHGELFERVYTTANQLVLQTCIEANGEPSWGRLFIIAEPI